MSLDPKMLESFNKIKNRIYKDNNYSNRYDFQELAEILSRSEWSIEELIALRALKRYVFKIKESVEDLGSKIIETIQLDFSNKIRAEEFIRDIIIIIDEFIDSLQAIVNVIEFDENRINVEMSSARLKSLRNSLIKKMNEFNRSSGVTMDLDQTNFMKILVTDIIDSLIKESFQLRIQRLSEILEDKID